MFTELDSTNRHLLATPPPVGALNVCIAEYQTAGRGRRGRGWNVPLGGGICLSAGWQFAGMPAELAALTLAVGVVVRRVLKRIAGLEIALKWPNDLVFDERKLGGILLELAAEAHGGAHVVAGIGLNVALPAELLPSLSDWPRGAIDLETALGREPPPRAVLAGALVNELAELFADYPQQRLRGLSQRMACRRLLARPRRAARRCGGADLGHGSSASMPTARCSSRRLPASDVESLPATSACRSG